MGRCYTDISKKTVKKDDTNPMQYLMLTQVKEQVSTAMDMAMSTCLKASKNCVFYDVNDERINWKDFGGPVYRYIGDTLIPPMKNR